MGLDDAARVSASETRSDDQSTGPRKKQALHREFPEAHSQLQEGGWEWGFRAEPWKAEVSTEGEEKPECLRACGFTARTATLILLPNP